jgi:transposase
LQPRRGVRTATAVREILIIDVVLRRYEVLDVARLLCLQRSTAYDILSRFLSEDTDVEPLPRAGGPARCFDAADLAALERLSERGNHLYVRELRELLLEETGLDASDSTIWRMLRDYCQGERCGYHSDRGMCLAAPRLYGSPLSDQPCLSGCHCVDV